VQIRDRYCKLFDVGVGGGGGGGGQGIIDDCGKSKYGVITECLCFIDDVGLKK
jgi:hypothetical protein